ncbi:MAG TPA: nucleoside transporter C-terminal domain-containing protein [Phycisphaerales bacterium]|nr:nucleoside transporter C-terminal domain-containing protein [Phycisphaerales bacterium]
MHLQGLVGVIVLLAIAWAVSTSRRHINWRLVIAGVLLQFVIAVLLLRVPGTADAFQFFARGVTKVISFADEGIAFIFGSLADASKPWGFVFAIKVLPIIIFFASLMAVLYHLGIMQRVVGVVATLLRRTLGVTGVEALSASANIFVGQTEAPLTVRPYIATMTRSQIMAIMAGGFATIAGSVMAAYIVKLGGDSESQRVLFATHLMTASVMSAPAGLVMAKLMLPETETPRDESIRSLLEMPRETRNVLDAASAGATDGLKLALNVGAMLLAFVALLALLNWPISALSQWGPIDAWRVSHGLPVFTFQNLLGMIFQPLAWCMGVPWRDCSEVGTLMGTQLIATEFVAYLNLADHIAQGTIDPRTSQIAAYALCGFANFPSIAIQIGGLSALAPERRSEFASIGLRAMVAGALACWMTGAVASVVMP